MDSLETLLNQHPDADTHRVGILLQLSESLYGMDLKKMVEYAEEAVEVSRKQDFKRGIGQGYLWKSAGLILGGEFEKATGFADSANKFCAISGDLKGKARSMNMIGICHFYRGDKQTALQKYLEAYDMMVELGDSGNIAKVCNNIGLIYESFEQNSEALQYYDICRQICVKQNNKNLLANVLNNIAVVYIQTEQFEKAIPLLEEALEINEEIGALVGIQLNCNNLSEIYAGRKQFDAARKVLQKSMDASVQANSGHGIAVTRRNLGNLFLLSGQLDSAAHHLNWALNWSDENDATEIKLSVLVYMVRLAEARKDYKKALEYNKAHFALHDSLLGEKKYESLAEVRVKYQSEKTEEENALLRERDAANEEIIRQKNRTNWMISGGLVLLLAFLFGLLRSQARNRKTYRLLETQKRDIEKINEQLEELNREKDSLMGIVAHDLKAPLVKVKSLARMLTMTGDLNERQQDVIGMMESVTDSGETLIRNLLDLTAAEQAEEKMKMESVELKNFILGFLPPHLQRAEEKQIKLSAEIPEDLRLTTEKNYFSRILDNLVSNALKFSTSHTEVVISGEADGNDVLLRVKDQGPGISREDQQRMFRKFQKLTAQPTGGENSTGLGLSIIKTLTEKLGGTIAVKSELGDGTEFILRFPQNPSK